jgi:RNA polymerase primary sigma factor/RNA polymerase sigma factor
MGRRLPERWRIEALGELTRQLLRTPAEPRLAQLERAERLHDELDPASVYPLDFVSYRITAYRPADVVADDSDEPQLLVGEAVAVDLRLLIDRLSWSLDLRRPRERASDAAGHWHTLDELAERLGVSVRTLERYRQRGLRWRWMVAGPRRRKVVVIEDAAWRLFERDRLGLVDAALRFRGTVEPAERRRLLRRVREADRRMRREDPDVSPTAVLRAVAEQEGRSVETLRRLSARHDRVLPDHEVLRGRRAVAGDRARRLAVRAAGRGVAVQRVAERVGRTPATVYRWLREAQAARLLDSQVVYVASPLFKREDAEAVLLVGLEQELAAREQAGAAALPEDHAELARLVRRLLAGWNYAKSRSAAARRRLAAGPVRRGDLREASGFDRRAARLLTHIEAAAEPVRRTVVQRHLASPLGAGQSEADLQGLVERTVVRSIEGYDFTRPAAFEEYLRLRLLQRLARDEPTVDLPPGAFGG